MISLMQSVDIAKAFLKLSALQIVTITSIAERLSILRIQRDPASNGW
jgi:hypothetical protein